MTNVNPHQYALGLVVFASQSQASNTQLDVINELELLLKNYGIEVYRGDVASWMKDVKSITPKEFQENPEKFLPAMSLVDLKSEICVDTITGLQDGVNIIKWINRATAFNMTLPTPSTNVEQ